MRPESICELSDGLVSKKNNVGPSQSPMMAFMHTQTGASWRSWGSVIARRSPCQASSDRWATPCGAPTKSRKAAAAYSNANAVNALA